MHCPHCNQQHPAGTLFCPTTGREIPRNLVCPHCGLAVDPAWDHCTHCGQELLPVQMQFVPPAKAVKTRKPFPRFGWLVILLGVLCNLFLVAGIVVFFLMKGDGPGGGASGRASQGGGGLAWVGVGPQGGEVLALTFDPFTPSTLYAGTASHGVFKSSDGGVTWQACDTGPALEYKSSLSVGTLVMDTSRPGTLYAGSAGLFVSTDGCGTWQNLSAGLPEYASVTLVAVDPVNPSTLYIDTNIDGLFRSTDGGQTWDPLGKVVSGSTMDLQYNLVGALLIDPLDPSSLLAATWEGLIRSSDAGQTWHLQENGIPSITIFTLVPEPGSPATLYAGTSQGVYRSTDAGQSWKKTNTNFVDNPFTLLAFDPADPTSLYAVMEAQRDYERPLSAPPMGVFKSTDGGGVWMEMPIGSYKGGIHALVFDPQTPSRLLAGTGEGILLSLDSGETWNPSNTGLSTFSILSLVIDPTSPATLYVAAGAGGVLKSTDGGGSWLYVKNGLDASEVYTLAIDPQNPAILYAGTKSGVYKTTDGGESWTAINNGMEVRHWIPSVMNLLINPNTPTTLYAYAQYEDVFMSIDGGESWKALNIGIENVSVNTTLIDPQGSDVLYLGTYNGVYKSTDGGGTWDRTSHGLPDTPIVKSLAIDPLMPSTLYAGVFADGLYKSSDGGGSWTPLETDFSYASMSVLAMAQGGKTYLYALGTDNDVFYYPESSLGLFVTTDGGRNWTELLTDLPPLFVYSLSSDSVSPPSLYLATTHGVFKSVPGAGK